MDNDISNQPIIESEEFSCDVCGEKFKSVTELTEHKTRHGRPGLGLRDEQSSMRGDIGAAGMPGSPII